ncbi:MAG TPA: hypothetical protein VD865_06505 [Stenotrophomonas sp.]|nr:hypothetical protein [Stenotrophomonas sp.]
MPESQTFLFLTELEKFQYRVAWDDPNWPRDPIMTRVPLIKEGDIVIVCNSGGCVEYRRITNGYYSEKFRPRLEHPAPPDNKPDDSGSRPPIDGQDPVSNNFDARGFAWPPGFGAYPNPRVTVGTPRQIP